MMRIFSVNSDFRIFEILTIHVMKLKEIGIIDLRRDKEGIIVPERETVKEGEWLTEWQSRIEFAQLNIRESGIR